MLFKELRSILTLFLYATATSLALTAGGCLRTEGGSRMNYTLDLSHGRELKDVHWPAKLGDDTTWELPINGGKFIAVLPGGRRLRCNPERVFIKRDDNKLWNIWMVFPKGDKRQVIKEAAMLCDQLGMAEKRSIVVAIEQAALRPGEMTSIYEKIISSEELADSEISSLAIDARGSGYKESPLRLYWQVYFESDSPYFD